MGGALTWEASNSNLLAKMFQLVHGRAAPISRIVSLHGIQTLPLSDREPLLISYLTQEEFHGDGFARMREDLQACVASFARERKEDPPDFAGDLGLGLQFLCQVAPSQAILSGTSSFRLDQMVIVRGVNVYPAALDNIVRGHPAIDEYEAFVRTDRSMAELVLRVEIRDGGRDGAAESLAADVHARLQLRPTVEVAEPGSLSRYELKSRRFKGVIDE